MTAWSRWLFSAADAPSRLRETGDQLDGILAEHGASARAQFAARLIAEELVLNAFEHGGATFVVMGVDPAGDPLSLIFVDDGVQFDPTAPRTSENPVAMADVSPRGRGLTLVLSLTRSIQHRRADGRNRLSVLLPP